MDAIDLEVDLTVDAHVAIPVAVAHPHFLAFG
jgi:hypothetical protein